MTRPIICKCSMSSLGDFGHSYLIDDKVSSVPIELLSCPCFLPLWILRCFQDLIRFLKFIGFVPGFSWFVRDERFVPTGFRSLLLGNLLDHCLLFIFQFSTGMFKTIKVALQTNKTYLIILAICWLYMWTFIMLNLDHTYLSFLF